jgi:predicted 3-demethylubiquinone-9 3-methyltransferase (glyoxalase superfamily)
MGAFWAGFVSSVLSMMMEINPPMLQPQKIIPCLWYDGQAEAAANFYVTLFPDSHVDRVYRSPADTPSGPAGSVLTVEFTLAGQRYLGLNGGPEFKFNEAVSFQVFCDDQAEVDRLWSALTKEGTPIECGWLKDRWGLSWQIVPVRLRELLMDSDRDRARRAMQAMMTMVKIDIAALERAADTAGS